MKVAVVGGGFAGLAAAVELLDRGAEVVLVERRPQLGGRAYSYRDGVTGDVVDNGQHVLFGCYRETLAFLERIGAGGRLWSAPRLDVRFFEGGRETALRAPALPHPLDGAAALLRLGGLGLGDKLAVARAVRAVVRLAPDRLAALDGITVEAWLAGLGQSREAVRRFWEPLAVAALNETVELASARWLAAVVRGVFGSGPGGGRVLLPRVGLSELYTGAAEAAIRARGGQVRRGVAATRVEVGPDGRAAGLTLEEGGRIAADAVVLAVPHADLGPLLPESLRASEPFSALDRLGSSPIVSVHLWLDREPTARPFAGLLGTSMHWLFNLHRIRGGEPGHLCLVASAARELAAMGREEIERRAVAELERSLEKAAGAVVRRAVAVVQRDSTPSLRPGLASLRTGAVTPVANLALAGDWTDPELPATIEAAVASGRRAARHLVP